MNSDKATVRIPHPSGWLRAAMRFPILLYRLKLGWLLGKRFLLLEHRGRKTGMIRKAVVEVVAHDGQKGSYVVAAAWGSKADWYKNITAAPDVHIQVGARRFSAIARTLPADEAARQLEIYAAQHPFAFRRLGSRLLDSKAQDTAQLIRSFVATVPFVEFTPG